MNYLLTLVLLIFLPIQLHATSILGKVLEYESLSETPKLYPLYDGDIINTSNKYILRLSGATLIADSNTEIRVKQESDITVFNMTKGLVRFRFNTNQIRISFRTPYGEVFTPRIVQISNNIVDGQITVKDTTILELNEGTLEARTLNGIIKIDSGQAVLLTQADIGQSEIEKEQVDPKTESEDIKTNNDSNTEQVPTSLTLLQERVDELLRLIGEEGVAKTPLVPKGEVELIRVETWEGQGEVVDYDLSVIKDASLPEGTPVKVICVKIKGAEDSELLVRPLDRLYPEQEGEKSLVNLDAEAESDMQPEGFINLKADENDEELSKRSLENWNAVIVDSNMQPKEDAYILEDTDLKTVCLRSALLVKPTYLVNKNYLDLVGKTAVVVKEFSSPGKVKVEGKIYDGILVDYNLQMKPISEIIPVGTELTVVGVRGSDSTVLLQKPSEVLEELKFVGNTAEAIDKMKPYGEVLLANEDGRKWTAVVVTDDLIPFYGVEVEKGSKLTVVSVFTQLLVTESDVLLAWYDPSAASQIASALLSPLGAAAAVGVAAVITTVTIIATDDNKGGGATPPPPPVNPDEPVVSPFLP